MTIAEKVDYDVEEKIQQLKEKLEKEMKPDSYGNTYSLYRFLKATDFDLDQAEISLKKHIEWRKELKLDNVLTEKVVPEGLEPYLPQTFIGFDKEDCPVRYFSYGNTDTAGMRMAIKQSAVRRYIYKVVEEDTAILDKRSKMVDKYLCGTLYIVNMENFSFATATEKQNIQDAIFLSRTYPVNYPERLKCLIFINSSSYFSIAFSMVKNFIQASVLEKIKIYTTPEEWKPELLKLVDADVLPAFLGGKKTDPDGNPLCKTFIKHGGPVPASLFIHKSTRSLAKAKDSKKLTLSRASFSEIEVEIKEAGSFIEWEFETKTRDIGFGLFHKEITKDEEEKITELVPLLRLDTEFFSETGVYKCEEVGTYVILFDNSYSWVRSKEIFYRINVKTPKEHEREAMS